VIAKKLPLTLQCSLDSIKTIGGLVADVENVPDDIIATLLCLLHQHPAQTMSGMTSIDGVSMLALLLLVVVR